ncbi:hypothetical protein [Pseudobutyrivibrio ruminis]|uniref:hypothetical protein n=1 Tax=Pseudobutyrivibrio ruminis TaxID=46206 RepID=UPI00051BFEA7|nr:hypothetical protein [Pseudobutyrivibrio ruminis]
MKDKTLEEKTRQIKELIAERMVGSIRFLFECFIDTEAVDVVVSREGTEVVTEVATQKYAMEPASDLRELLKRHATLSNIEKKEYGDREAMKLVFTILLNLYAGGHIKDEAFRQKEMLNVIKKKLKNYKVVDYAYAAS